MSNNHHIGNPADSACRIPLAELKNQLFDELGKLNALNVILERFEHHAQAMVDANLEEMNQREFAAMVTAAQCVVGMMSDANERRQDRLSVIETTVDVDDETYAMLKRLAAEDGIDPDTLATFIVRRQIQRMMNQSGDSTH